MCKNLILSATFSLGRWGVLWFQTGAKSIDAIVVEPAILQVIVGDFEKPYSHFNGTLRLSQSHRKVLRYHRSNLPHDRP